MKSECICKNCSSSPARPHRRSISELPVSPTKQDVMRSRSINDTSSHGSPRPILSEHSNGYESEGPLSNQKSKLGEKSQSKDIFSSPDTPTTPERNMFPIKAYEKKESSSSDGHFSRQKSIKLFLPSKKAKSDGSDEGSVSK